MLATLQQKGSEIAMMRMIRVSFPLLIAAGVFLAPGPALAAPSTPAPTAPDAPPAALARMQEPGPEAKNLAQRVGSWDVTMTLRLTPDAKPLISKGLLAERRMIGLFLEERMSPAPGSGVPDFQRIAYLHYNGVEGRWQYVSLDTRFPAGVMPAHSFDKTFSPKLTLEFDAIGFVGLGQEVEGRLVRSNFVIALDGKNHERHTQVWVQADGTGNRWPAVEYEFTRRAGVH
jgi:hypothetical protein